MSQRENGRRRFLTASGAGALALAGFAKVEAAEWSDAERANVKTVTDFCAAWSTRDLARVLPFLSDDCVYRMTETTPPANGHDGVTARLKSSVEGSDRVQFQVLDTFATGPIVINHRIDQFVSSRPLTWEGVGVFFVKDGKIKEWSDYTIRVQRS
jgi:limonene-1,2-epoxide hydrolase